MALLKIGNRKVRVVSSKLKAKRLLVRATRFAKRQGKRMPPKIIKRSSVYFVVEGRKR